MKWAPDDIALSDEQERRRCHEEADAYVGKWGLEEREIEPLARQFLRERINARRTAALRFLFVSGLADGPVVREVARLCLETNRMPLQVMNDEGYWKLGMRDLEYLGECLAAIERCGDVCLDSIDDIFTGGR